MYTFSADASHPLLIQEARSSSWKGSSRCKAENPRYKCQVRLSAFHLFPALPAFSVFLAAFRHRGRKLSLLLSLDVTVFPRSIPFPLYPHHSLILYFQISSCLSTTLSCLPPSSCCLEISTPLGLFQAHLYPFPPPPRLIFLSLVLLSISPWPPFPRLFLRVLPISRQCETTNEVQEEYNNAPTRA